MRGFGGAAPAGHPEGAQEQLGGPGAVQGGGRVPRGAAGSVTAPLTGTVAKVPVAEGDAVEAGQIVVLLEAMKVEIAVEAPRAGRVIHIGCARGDLVQAGEVLAEIGD